MVRLLKKVVASVVAYSILLTPAGLPAALASTAAMGRGVPVEGIVAPPLGGLQNSGAEASLPETVGPTSGVDLGVAPSILAPSPALGGGVELSLAAQPVALAAQPSHMRAAESPAAAVVQGASAHGGGVENGPVGAAAEPMRAVAEQVAGDPRIAAVVKDGPSGDVSILSAHIGSYMDGTGLPSRQAAVEIAGDQSGAALGLGRIAAGLGAFRDLFRPSWVQAGRYLDKHGDALRAIPGVERVERRKVHHSGNGQLYWGIAIYARPDADSKALQGTLSSYVSRSGWDHPVVRMFHPGLIYLPDGVAVDGSNAMSFEEGALTYPASMVERSGEKSGAGLRELPVLKPEIRPSIGVAVGGAAGILASMLVSASLPAALLLTLGAAAVGLGAVLLANALSARKSTRPAASVEQAGNDSGAGFNKKTDIVALFIGLAIVAGLAGVEAGKKPVSWLSRRWVRVSLVAALAGAVATVAGVLAGWPAAVGVLAGAVIVAGLSWAFRGSSSAASVEQGGDQSGAGLSKKTWQTIRDVIDGIWGLSFLGFLGIVAYLWFTGRPSYGTFIDPDWGPQVYVVYPAVTAFRTALIWVGWVAGWTSLAGIFAAAFVRMILGEPGTGGPSSAASVEKTGDKSGAGMASWGAFTWARHDEADRDHRIETFPGDHRGEILDRKSGIQGVTVVDVRYPAVGLLPGGPLIYVEFDGSATTAAEVEAALRARYPDIQGLPLRVSPAGTAAASAVERTGDRSGAGVARGGDLILVSAVLIVLGVIMTPMVVPALSALGIFFAILGAVGALVGAGASLWPAWKRAGASLPPSVQPAAAPVREAPKGPTAGLARRVIPLDQIFTPVSEEGVYDLRHRVQAKLAERGLSGKTISREQSEWILGLDAKDPAQRSYVAPILRELGNDHANLPRWVIEETTEGDDLHEASYWGGLEVINKMMQLQESVAAETDGGKRAALLSEMERLRPALPYYVSREALAEFDRSYAEARGKAPATPAAASVEQAGNESGGGLRSAKPLTKIAVAAGIGAVAGFLLALAMPVAWYFGFTLAWVGAVMGAGFTVLAIAKPRGSRPASDVERSGDESGAGFRDALGALWRWARGHKVELVLGAAMATLIGVLAPLPNVQHQESQAQTRMLSSNRQYEIEAVQKLRAALGDKVVRIEIKNYVYGYSLSTRVNVVFDSADSLMAAHEAKLLPDYVLVKRMAMSGEVTVERLSVETTIQPRASGSAAAVERAGDKSGGGLSTTGRRALWALLAALALTPPAVWLAREHAVAEKAQRNAELVRFVRGMKVLPGNYVSSNGFKVSVTKGFRDGLFRVRADGTAGGRRQYVSFELDTVSGELYRIYSNQETFYLREFSRDERGNNFYSFEYGDAFTAREAKIELRMNPATGELVGLNVVSSFASLGLPNGWHSGPIKETPDAFSLDQLTRVPSPNVTPAAFSIERAGDKSGAGLARGTFSWVSRNLSAILVALGLSGLLGGGIAWYGFYSPEAVERAQWAAAPGEQIGTLQQLLGRTWSGAVRGRSTHAQLDDIRTGSVDGNITLELAPSVKDGQAEWVILAPGVRTTLRLSALDLAGAVRLNQTYVAHQMLPATPYRGAYSADLQYRFSRNSKGDLVLLGKLRTSDPAMYSAETYDLQFVTGSLENVGPARTPAAGAVERAGDRSGAGLSTTVWGTVAIIGGLAFVAGAVLAVIPHVEVLGLLIGLPGIAALALGSLRWWLGRQVEAAVEEAQDAELARLLRPSELRQLPELTAHMTPIQRRQFKNQLAQSAIARSVVKEEFLKLQAKRERGEELTPEDWEKLTRYMGGSEYMF